MKSLLLTLHVILLTLWVAPLQAGISVYQQQEPVKAFLESDVYVLEKQPVIVRPGQYIRNDSTFLIDDKAIGNADEVYIEVVGDWIEPIPLTTQANSIRVAVIQGEAEWASPESPEEFSPLSEGQEIPVGSRLRVGEAGCIGLDVGGRHAVCLTPGAEGVILRDLSRPEDQIEIVLSKGAVFSHVNLKGLPTDYRIRTPHGVAAARGTDYVTVALPDVTDVWIQEGTVELLDLNDNSVGTVSSTDGGAPKIIRFPPAADDLARIEANSATLTAAATLIPQLNIRLPKLKAKQARGEALTDEERSFLNKSKRMHYLLKVERL